MALTYPSYGTDGVSTALWSVVLVGLALYRTLRPVRATSRAALVRGLGLESVLASAAVVATGQWGSPFVFALITPPIIAGLAAGWMPALAACSTSVLVVSVTDRIDGGSPAREVVQWVVELVLVSLISGYARFLLGETEEERTRNLSRIGQLADANALLFSLHRVAQSLPASLDLDEALDSSMSRLRELIDFDAAAVLLLDDTDGSWQVARRDAVRVPTRLTSEELPRGLQRAAALRSVVREDNLLATGGPGLAPSRSSGLYHVLSARGAVIGLVSIEHKEPNRFSDRDVELLEGFAEPAALAIDNARWFGRLRTVGAEEERSRIARDLHDRIGQSLAYLAFELDRIVKADERGEVVGPALHQLREDVRSVITEVRDTLYDLRTDVSEGQSFLATVRLFADRIRERNEFELTIRSDERARLPIPQERELFRIAQEALVNVERHADARHVTITWHCDGHSAELVVADDGNGFPVGRSGRLDSYGLVGMRERAASVGARLDVESTPGTGTRIRCRIG